jgi:hypothetical protein
MITEVRISLILIIAPLKVMGMEAKSLEQFSHTCYHMHSLNPTKVSGVYTDTSYASLKLEIGNIKSSLNRHTLSEDSISNLFTSFLVDRIIPHWLGTPWSFEGHTSIPGSGEIACGYFVSTTLKDVGFDLDRYKFAQQLPIYEAKTLALGKPLLEINSNSTNERIATLRDTLKEGIYFIGFDQSHVGYIQKKNGELFVIHSNYIRSEGVVIERIKDSKVFSYYTRIYIMDISRNAALMKKWVGGEALQVVAE